MNNANSHLEGLVIIGEEDTKQTGNDKSYKGGQYDNKIENSQTYSQSNTFEDSYNNNHMEINADMVKRKHDNSDKDINTNEKTKMKVIRPCKKKQVIENTGKSQNYQDDYVNKINKFNGNDNQSKDAVLNVLKHCCFPMEMHQKEKLYKTNSKNAKVCTVIVL